MSRSKILIAATATALALSFSTAASALTTFSLTDFNVSGYPAPFGSVSVDLVNSTTADVTFTTDQEGNFQYFFIDGGSADVNVNAATWTLSNLANSNSFNAESPGTLSAGNPGQIDGWGSFNQTINQSDGYGSPSTSISFRLTNTGGTWASSDNVLKANDSGHSVAAHIAVCDLTASATCSSDIQAPATGFATNGPAAVPEPVTWALMLLGFFATGTLLRRRRKVLAAA